jgi:hypothetical protein
VGFVLNKVVLGHFFSEFFGFSPVNIIPPWLSILISCGGMNNSPIGGHSSPTDSHRINMNNLTVGESFYFGATATQFPYEVRSPYK